MINVYLPILLLFIGIQAQAQSERDIAFYNVENLFDTLDTEGKTDGEFLPDGKREWNTAKYNEKLAHINQVIGEFNNPLIIGLCEIENKAVVLDIVKYGNLHGTYDVVHIESLDRRGIDNAIIYDSTTLTLEEHGVVRFEMPNPKYPSRDILWAKFSKGKETFYTMVNHWPSRWGGQEKSEPKRLVAANAAKKFIDSLHTVDKNVQIVFMGDLNDYPTNTAPKLIMETLCPMISPASGEMGGTHSYRGEWGVLDHIMVSKGLGKKKGISVVKGSGAIHNYDFIMTEYKGNIVPFRTYGGGKYLAGYSDHLPVTISVNL